MSKNDHFEKPLGPSVKAAYILLFVTTCIGGLMIITMSSWYSCWIISKCRADWQLPSECDDLELDAKAIDIEAVAQETSFPLQVATRGNDPEAESPVDEQAIRDAARARRLRRLRQIREAEQ
jgi:hypothetical protein